jgi:signal peptidase I
VKEVRTEATTEMLTSIPPGRERLAVFLSRLTRSRRPFTRWQAVVWAVAVAGYLMGGWWLVQFGLRGWLAQHPAFGFYLGQPLLWLGLAALSSAGWRRLGDRPRFSRVLSGIALLLGAFHVGLLVFAGIAAGFGESYVAGRLVNYPRNLWYLATWLLGLETARAFVFHTWRRFSERWAFAGTAVLLAVAMTPYGHIRSLGSADTLVSTLGGFLLPTLVLSMLATWLVDHGGPAPAIAYRGALLAFEWLSQVQPDLEWPILFLIGTIGPIFGARFIRSIYLGTTEGAARWDDHHEEAPVAHHGLAIATAVMAALIVFLGTAGLMGFRPSVVSGISMEPTIRRGDLVLIQQNVDPATVAVGDVVKFADPAGHTIVHRVIAVDHTPHGPVFTTQGDNNRGPDPQFGAERLRGKVVGSLRALGWPAIWARGG